MTGTEQRAIKQYKTYMEKVHVQLITKPKEGKTGNTKHTNIVK